MTPTVRDVLQGCVVALGRLTPPEAGPEYAAGRIGMVGTLTMLAAQLADRAAADALAENAAIRALFAEAPAYDDALGGRLSAAAGETDSDRTVPALDAANARLRRLLAELHEQVEAANDATADAKILALYIRMAAIRRMTLGGG